mmetsp:Transcript_147279/g.257306  ORF Transcript_147279/g.257306 Transcript_147279/m.257306 type:complete len:412 (-) Transcript_147279:537-1772(-)
MGNEPSCGYQIGRVVQNSPAHQAGLVPFFDFIQVVDGHPIAQRPATFFREYLVKAAGKNILLQVLNTKTRTYREVHLCPNNTWGGQGLLGCSINWEDVDKAITYAWHILDVNQGSNAHKAGIVPYRDYFVGMQATYGSNNSNEVFITMFQNEKDFHRRLEARIEQCGDPRHPLFRNQSILFLVYDSVANDLREISCNFPLGCDIGNGYLHSIPVHKGDTRIPTIRTFYKAVQGAEPPVRHSQMTDMVSREQLAGPESAQPHFAAPPSFAQPQAVPPQPQAIPPQPQATPPQPQATPPYPQTFSATPPDGALTPQAFSPPPQHGVPQPGQQPAAQGFPSLPSAPAPFSIPSFPPPPQPAPAAPIPGLPPVPGAVPPPPQFTPPSWDTAIPVPGQSQMLGPIDPSVAYAPHQH